MPLSNSMINKRRHDENTIVKETIQKKTKKKNSTYGKAAKRREISVKRRTPNERDKIVKQLEKQPE